MRKISRRLFILGLLSACSSLPATLRPSVTPLPTFAPLPTLYIAPALKLSPTVVDATELPAPAATAVPINVVVSDSNSNCLTPIVAPTSAPIPPVGGVDSTTGRNVMGVVQVLDLASYQLAVTGRVDHPLYLALDDLRCMPKMTEKVTTTCYNFHHTATWSGVLLSEVLNKAGVQPGATQLVQNAADGASRPVPLEMAMDPHNFLAYQMQGEPIPILFGFPVRSIFIDVAGQYSVKWLISLEVI